MHLVSIYSQENQIITEIDNLIKAAGINIRSNEILPKKYENVITATALSLVQHAKKIKVNPITLLDIEKLPLIIKDYENGVVKFNGYNDIVELLTKYKDYATLRGAFTINYKQNYDIHPIEKLFDNRRNISKLTINDHYRICLSKLKEANIKVDMDDFYETFKNKNMFMVPTIVDKTDSRLMIRYSPTHGSLFIDYYNVSLDFQQNFPNFSYYLKNEIIRKIHEILNGNDSTRLNGKILIDLSHNAKNNNLVIKYYVPLTLPDNKLKIIDRNYLYFYSNIPIQVSDLEEFENTGTNKVVFQCADSVVMDISRRLKNKIGEAKRRLKIKKSLGEKNISIDKISQEMIMLIANEDPEWAKEIISGKKNYYIFKNPHNFVYEENIKKPTSRIRFSYKDGHISSIFTMSENQYWQKNKLLVPKIPEIYATSFIGSPAKDIIDHPIAKYLGSVKRITNIQTLSIITFQNTYEAVTHEDFLKRIDSSQIMSKS